MKTLGLTGGIGMGKTTAAQLLKERGVPVVDTDDLARQIVEPGQPALVEIQRVFGADIIGADGRLLRAELARRVFPAPEARHRLEAILHPRIRQLWKAQMEAWRAAGPPLAMVVIPLLFETGAEQDLDATICVACSHVTQMERLRPRGWPPEQVQQRLQAQWPVERKMAAANFVVWTEGGVDVHLAQLQRILRLCGGGLEDPQH